MNLLERPLWIFDMDGTLTRAMHDFDEARARMDLPAGAPILESLQRLSPQEAAPKHAALHAWEAELADRAQAAPDAVALVEALSQRGAQLGVLTRNTRDLALRTLEVSGLLHFFDPIAILGRDNAAPKPSPEGVQRLLNHWSGAASSAVMVGDYVFDVQAGRRAGTATVLIDREDHGRWRDEADFCVSRLDALLS